MDNYNHKKHWNKAYENSINENLGWYENNPKATIDLIERSNISKESLIFSAGVGSSILINLLLEKGFNNIIVNDISSVAIKKLKLQIIESEKIIFIEDDLTNSKKLKNIEMVDLWHDRAVLHFFTRKKHQLNYFDLLKSKVKLGGYVIFSEFAVGGASKCCGLDIVNYNTDMFQSRLGNDFHLLESFNYEYKHPSNGNTRKYIYALYNRIRR